MLDQKLRTNAAYQTARKAIDALERVRIWPTVINYELALHYVGDPEGPLARAIEKILQQGDYLSDDFSEKLARDFLPRLRMELELSDAGGSLNRELERVGRVLDEARVANAQTAGSMAAAGDGLAAASSVDEAQLHIRAAADAIAVADARAAAYKIQLEASADEVSRLRQQMQHIQRDALTDPLTSLNNRRAFQQNLERACAEADASGAPLSLAMIDIDHFKMLNDRWGHQTGDQVIRFIGGLISALAIPPRMAARYGGEEFAVIMPRETVASAVRSHDQLRQEISSRVLTRRATREELGQVTISIGISQHRRGESLTAFVERADVALYASKRDGRNRITCSSERGDG